MVKDPKSDILGYFLKQQDGIQKVDLSFGQGTIITLKSILYSI